MYTQLTHAHTATACVSPHVHSTCTSYVLYAYLYCIYALVGGEISILIRISVPFTSLCQSIARCLPHAHCLCSKNVVIGFKTGIEAYFVVLWSKHIQDVCYRVRTIIGIIYRHFYQHTGQYHTNKAVHITTLTSC